MCAPFHGHPPPPVCGKEIQLVPHAVDAPFLFFIRRRQMHFLCALSGETDRRACFLPCTAHARGGTVQEWGALTHKCPFPRTTETATGLLHARIFDHACVSTCTCGVVPRKALLANAPVPGMNAPSSPLLHGWKDECVGDGATLPGRLLAGMVRTLVTSAAQ